MSTPSPCSTGSAPSRLEWRPSRLQAVAQLLVLIAAPWLIAASAVPTHLQLPVVVAAWVLGGVGCWLGRRRGRHVLWLQTLPRPLLLDGRELRQLHLHVRGPWLLLRWHSDHGRGHLLFWPDTLDPVQRRELRLAVSARAVPQEGQSMAP